ncbi:MAG TPA: hypothetical protein PKZ97_01925 [Azospirillaceae bacterium]|nr:hypothetical protein [Azospirillaceae bacterium]HRQ79854.1 hypothetical protein [Azospirillaceae bacterium]
MSALLFHTLKFVEKLEAGGRKLAAKSDIVALRGDGIDLRRLALSSRGSLILASRPFER